VVVGGKEYAVDCLIYASGFELASEYTRRLGFDIRGRGGKSLRDGWADGPATLHGMTSRGYPNLLMFSPTQSGWAINFVHIIDEQSQHAAYIIERCLQRGIETIEPTEQAQQEWFEAILGSLRKNTNPFGGPECTPGYYNNEGAQFAPSMLRGAPFGDALTFFEILKNWRQRDELAGLEVTYGDRKA